MVEDIEPLRTEFPVHPLGNLYLFQKGQVEVIQAWPMEECAVCGALPPVLRYSMNMQSP